MEEIICIVETHLVNKDRIAHWRPTEEGGGIGGGALRQAAHVNAIGIIIIIIINVRT